MLTKKQNIALIEKAFKAIPYLAHGFSDARENLFCLNLTSEKKHRKNKEYASGLSVILAAKLFTIKFLADAIEKPNNYTIVDVLAVRLECLYAQAYVSLHSDKIQKAWADENITIDSILSIDYAELMKV